MGINSAGLVPSNRHIEGVVEMMLDATQRHTLPLTEKRSCGWHAALFPTGYSGPYKIEVGRYRTGEMQVVSGAMGKEKVHYEAVSAKLVNVEMDKFLDWFNNDNSLDLVLKAAIAHFWFIIIHPFDDGNGRMGRAITDMLLARAEGSGERFYSMSSQILVERKRYYEVLQKRGCEAWVGNKPNFYFVFITRNLAGFNTCKVWHSIKITFGSVYLSNVQKIFTSIPLKGLPFSPACYLSRSFGRDRQTAHYWTFFRLVLHRTAEPLFGDTIQLQIEKCPVVWANCCIYSFVCKYA